VPIKSLEDLALPSLIQNISQLQVAYRLLAQLKCYISDIKKIAAIMKSNDNKSFFELPHKDIKKITSKQWIFLLSDFEKRILSQVDSIISHSRFRQTEANWLSIKHLLASTEDYRICHIDVLDISKQVLTEDCQDSSSFLTTQLYDAVYTQELGQFGGLPYACIIGAYEFSSTATDIEVLRIISQVCAVAHAPFIAAASSTIWSLTDYKKFINISQVVEAHKTGKVMKKWQGLVKEPSSKYLFLSLPKVKLRGAYHYAKNDTGGLPFIEKNTGNNQCLWGISAFCIAECLFESFHNCKSGLGVTAEHGNKSNLGMPELLLDYDACLEFIDNGFVPLLYKKEDKAVLFYAIPSINNLITKKSKSTKTEEQLGEELVRQLPYLMMISRVMQYLRVIQRDTVGNNDMHTVKVLLKEWLGNYVADMENPTDKIRIKRPLRSAEIDISPSKDGTNDMIMSLKIVPHMKYYGKAYNLSLDSSIAT